MSKNNSLLLSDTLNLIQMAHASASSQESEKIAEKLSPILKRFRELVESERETPDKSSSNMQSQKGYKVFQDDYLENQLEGLGADRNLMISTMSAKGMSDLEIAKHFGISRDEVRIILNLSKMNTYGSPV
ncbi:MAG: hypothetical protein JEZ06_06110 [Anaerolineaceae bacterium]|nr:hypothetical protein [Anaerolineaceae bacterium]